jgi:DGQHR domain-containing protein
MELIAIRGVNLNTPVYRGFAKLGDLARISAPDTYNQDTNPDGLQRDLSEAHARDGYQYAQGSQDVPDHPRVWPEMLLNVRDPAVLRVDDIGDMTVPDLVRLTIHEERIDLDTPRPQISRTDGNHRLHYAGGDEKRGWPPLDVSTPFCLTVGLSPEQEANLFMDINDNQKAMNTSHLAHLKARLGPEEIIVRHHPDLWIAEHLADDAKSSWHGMVHKGGERTQGLKRRVNLAALRTGVKMTLDDSVKMRGFDAFDIYSRYIVIRTYWNAVATMLPDQWADPRAYLLLRGIGIWTMSMLGAEIIDRCLMDRPEPAALQDRMESYLRQARMVLDWDARTGNIKGYGGRSGAREAAELMKRTLSSEDVDMRALADALRRAALV